MGKGKGGQWGRDRGQGREKGAVGEGQRGQWRGLESKGLENFEAAVFERSLYQVPYQSAPQPACIIHTRV